MRSEQLFAAVEAAAKNRLETMRRKNKDYAQNAGVVDDAFRNFEQIENLFGIPTIYGFLTRLTDKFMRSGNLLVNSVKGAEGPAVADEKVIDTIDDMINYLDLLRAYITQDTSAQTDLFASITERDLQR